MIRKILIFLQTILIFSLSAASGIAADTPAPQAETVKLSPAEVREKALALFISALLEKDPEKQCLQFIEVVEIDPANAETPLAAFQTAIKKVKNRAAVIKNFNALWRKFPGNIFILLHGAELNRVSQTDPQERLQLLEYALSLSPAAAVKQKNWEPNVTFILLRNAADCLMELKQYSGLSTLFRSWINTPQSHRIQACTLLARTCYIAAARSYSNGDLKTAEELEQCFNAAVAALRKTEPAVSSESDALPVILFYSSFRQLLKDDLLRFTSNFRKRIKNHRTDSLLLSAAVECGELELFNEAANSITKRIPRYDTAELRFKALLNSGRFADAEAEIKRMPQKHHFELKRRLLYKKGDWRGLYSLVSSHLAQGGVPDPAMGIILASIAEKLNDKNIFRQAKRILSSHTGVPVVANAVGYIGSILDEDLPECRKLVSYALSKEPENIAYLDSMAWIAYKQGKFQEAEKWIRKALERITPTEGVAVIFEHAGDIALALKKDPVPWYKASLKYAPFDSEFDKASVLKKMKAVK